MMRSLPAKALAASLTAAAAFGTTAETASAGGQVTVGVT
jgi:hypothetical protein